jgi:uncharacterized protein (TIGR02996 family)
MTDHDAFIAAICENPDDDTPRLVFADWLDERDRPEQAAFIRAQIDLDRTPAWEPFAVHCKWRRTDWFTGNSFRDTLPAVGGYGVEWHHPAFRRGFGWRLNIKSLLAWEQIAPHLIHRVPVGEVHLWGGTLDDWRRFAASPIVGQLRRLHFRSKPIEPLLVLRDNPQALGITDIFFDPSTGAGMPEVVEDLLKSALGLALRGLHFRMGYESLDILIEKLNGASRLERLSFSTMGLTTDLINQLSDLASLRHLKQLRVENERSLGNEGIRALKSCLPQGVEDLTLLNVGVQADGLEVLTRTEQLGSLRRLDLSQNSLAPRAMKVLSASRSLSGLRSLRLNKCRVGDRGLRHLTRSKFWHNLVELDLRDNPISRVGCRYLMDAAMPTDLTALILIDEQIGADARNELRKKYGERLVLHTSS